MIALHTSAAKRKEENGLTKYGAGVGGRRPPPRGQRTPFKPMPKRFSASTPFRKFLPGNAPGASGAPGARPEQRARAALQAARELAELANVALAEAEHAAQSEDDADGQDDLAGQLSELVLTAPETPAPSAPAPVPATPTSLEIPGRVMPSVFSSEGFYVNVANEVELQQPQPVMGQPVPSTLDVLPSNVLAHVVGLSAEADLFVLCGVSRGFQLAVHEHVDGVFAAEERARKADFDFLRSEPSSATDTDDEIDEATPRPRSHGYFRFFGAVAAVSLLTWLISCALAVRSVIAWVFEAVTDASVMLPAGLSTILIIILFAARAQAYPAYGDLPETALGGHSGPIVLPYDVTAAAPAGHVFDLVETCKAAMATLATGPHPPNDAPAAIRFCWDSGCTCYCIPTEDMWMLDSVTDPQPNIGVEVASSTILMVQAIGTINSTFPPKLVCDSFRVDALGVRAPTVSAPCMSRVLVTKGIKASTRLAGVGPSRRLDKTLSFFNDDNSAGIEDCLRFADGAYVLATLCYAHAPECLWPWAAAHIERVLYFLPSRAHEPIKSAYHFTHPDAGDADLAWAKPLFCDVASQTGHARDEVQVVH